MISPFSCVFVGYILWMSLDIVVLFLNWIVCLYYWVVVIFKKIHSGYKSFLRYIYIVIFHLFCNLPFHFLNGVFQKVKLLTHMKFNLPVFLTLVHFLYCPRNLCLFPSRQRYSPVFRTFIVLAFTFKLWSIWVYVFENSVRCWWERWRFIFIFLMVSSWSVSLFEKILTLLQIALYVYKKWYTIKFGSFPGLLVVFHWSVCLFFLHDMSWLL